MTAVETLPLRFAGVLDASQGVSRRTRRRPGRYLICSAAGIIGDEQIELGDWAISDGKAWMIVHVDWKRPPQ